MLNYKFCAADYCFNGIAWLEDCLVLSNAKPRLIGMAIAPTQFSKLRQKNDLLRLLRPMLVASVLLHGLLLLLPGLDAEPPAPEPDAVEEETLNVVALSQLPGQEPPLSEATPETTPPAPAAAPPQGPVAPRPNQPIAQTAQPPQAAPAETQAFTPQATPGGGGAAGGQDPFLTDFPRYPGAQRGSFGLPPDYDPFSERTEDAASAVRGFYEQQLPALGFALQAVPGESQREVFLVSKGGAAQYLTLIPNATGAGTSILLSAQPLPSDLGSASVVTPEEIAFFSNLPVRSPDGSSDYQTIPEPQRLLAEPAAFYQNVNQAAGSGFVVEPRPKPGIRRSVLYARQSDPQAVFAALQPGLQSAGFQVTPMQNYGGGLLYQLTLGPFTGYLSLVPTSSSGTAVFVWNRPPG